MLEGSEKIPKISVMMSTVRDNYPLIKHPKTFIFTPTLKSLQKQTFKDFEFVLADYRKDERGNHLNRDWGFPIKHIKPKKSIWDDMRYPAIYNGFNNAIIHSDGELCILLGDCCEISKNFLERCWYWYKEKGLFAVSMVKFEGQYRDDCKVRRVLLAQGRDSLDNSAPIKGKLACWGYNAYSLEALLNVNGFDLNFDGTKSCGDEDLGTRLELAGYKFVIDGRLRAFEYHHNNPREKKDYLCGKLAKSNYLYSAFKWNATEKKEDLIFANNRPMHPKFAEYEADDFKFAEEHFATQEEYSKIRNLYISNPSMFNIKELWEKRKNGGG